MIGYVMLCVGFSAAYFAAVEWLIACIEADRSYRNAARNRQEAD
jgi:hypothetical protein